MSTLTLVNEALDVTVSPEVGGTITGIRHKQTGLSVLGEVPWKSVDEPLPSLAAHDEPEWLTRYTGGWPLLFPNGGDACEVGGTFHGFHGEASVAPWQAQWQGEALVLTRSFATVPATIRRTLKLAGETLKIEEQLDYSGAQPIDVMWGHHPTFGSDLLSSPFEITCGAKSVQAEQQYDPPASPILPGARGHWPWVAAQSGEGVDLAHPRSPWASVVYLGQFISPWAAVRRMDDAIAVLLTWDGTRFPCAWLWYELRGTAEAPWNGCTHLVGIEPNTTPCALGIREAMARQDPLLRLEPGASIQASINLQVFKPSGPILNGPDDIVQLSDLNE